MSAEITKEESAAEQKNTSNGRSSPSLDKIEDDVKATTPNATTTTITTSAAAGTDGGDEKMAEPAEPAVTVKPEKHEASPTPGTTESLNISTISLSDCEEVPPPPVVAAKVTKKRQSLGAVTTDRLPLANGEEEINTVGLKRRKIKVAGAPKLPLNSYVCFMNERRNTMRKEYPTKNSMEHTKLIAEEWQQMTNETKVPYVKAAEADKQRYISELNTFLKERPDVLESELARNKTKKSTEDRSAGQKERPTVNGNGKAAKEKEKPREKTPPVVKEAAKRKRTPTPVNGIAAPLLPGEIPIFTNDFLEHNKIQDMELRTLRKSKTDMEQQNAVLEKHVENMKFGVEKMTTENNETQEKNRLLEVYLDKLKRKLATALAGLSIPSEPNGATMDNIEKYMMDLHKMATTNTHGPASLNKAKDIIRKLDLQIQL